MKTVLALTMLSVFVLTACGMAEDDEINSTTQAVTSDPGCTNGDCPPDPDPGCTNGDCPPDPDPEPPPVPDYYSDCCCADLGVDNKRVCCCKDGDVANCRLSIVNADGSHITVEDVSMTGTQPKLCKKMFKKVCKKQWKKTCWKKGKKGKKVCKWFKKTVCKFIKKNICKYHWCGPDWFPTDVIWPEGSGCGWWSQIHHCPTWPSWPKGWFKGKKNGWKKGSCGK